MYIYVVELTKLILSAQLERSNYKFCLTLDREGDYTLLLKHIFWVFNICWWISIVIIRNKKVVAEMFLCICMEDWYTNVKRSSISKKGSKEKGKSIPWKTVYRVKTFYNLWLVNLLSFVISRKEHDSKNLHLLQVKDPIFLYKYMYRGRLRIHRIHVYII